MPGGVLHAAAIPSHASATAPVLAAARTSTDPPSPAIRLRAMSDPVLVDRDGYIATLTLNVPDKRNAMSAEMTDAFPQAVDRISRMDDVRAVVVTGAGAAFCAGGDLDFL